MERGDGETAYIQANTAASAGYTATDKAALPAAVAATIQTTDKASRHSHSYSYTKTQFQANKASITVGNHQSKFRSNHYYCQWWY